jgi:DNA replication protein DnaC
MEPKMTKKLTIRSSTASLFMQPKVRDEPISPKSAPETSDAKLLLKLSKKTSKAPPLALQYLHQLSSREYSSPFKLWLSSFDVPRERSLAVFVTGVLTFIQCVNKNDLERQIFYGDPLLGLHYRNDLVRHWNKKNLEKIKSEQLYSFCPCSWEFLALEGGNALVYKGDKPSEALDELMQGPTPFDCGQFGELAIWFGIRYMLGNELFDRSFGKTPFYITQVPYESIKNPLQPVGNPLHPFFQEVTVSDIKTSAVYITHVANHPEYWLKHPGSAYNGDNCLVINGKYMIFDPTVEKTTDLTREDVEKLLREAFNAKPNEHDQDKLDQYAKQKPTAINSNFNLNYKGLISLAEELAEKKLDEKDWKTGAQECKQPTIVFDFEKFCAWVEKNEALLLAVEYTPFAEEKLNIPVALMEQFPFENRETMSFSAFKIESPLQKQMHEVTIKFCADIMVGKSCCVIFSGKAGIGKTASAICAAKELVSRGKKVLWIAEVTVKGWADKATDMTDLSICQKKIRSLLDEGPDVVFLDDDNITGYAGKILLESIYLWYVTHPGKGLLITSNVAVNFKKCYGLELSGQMIPAPFLNYTSKQYENMIVLSALMGSSLRPTPDFKIAELTDEQKIEALLKCETESSVGIIVTPEAYLAKQHCFSDKDLEYVPAISDEAMLPIRNSLRHKDELGPDYEKLSEQQKKWLRQFTVGAIYVCGLLIPAHTGIAVRVFEKSDRTIITVEILSRFLESIKKRIFDGDCISQILSVINFAHDKGGKKVIFINKTSLPHSVLIENIKEEIKVTEKERTISRMENLLFSPYLRMSHTGKAGAVKHETSLIKPKMIEKDHSFLKKDEKDYSLTFFPKCDFSQERVSLPTVDKNNGLSDSLKDDDFNLH